MHCPCSLATTCPMRSALRTARRAVQHAQAGKLASTQGKHAASMERLLLLSGLGHPHSLHQTVDHPPSPKSVAGRATLPSSIATSTRCHKARASWSCRACSHLLAQQAILARQMPPSRAARAVQASAQQGSSVRGRRPLLQSRAMRENIVRQAPSHLCRVRRGASRLRPISSRPATAPIALQARHARRARQYRRLVRQAPSRRLSVSLNATHATAVSTKSRADRRRARRAQVAATVHPGRRLSCRVWPGHTRICPTSSIPTTALLAPWALLVALVRRCQHHACLACLVPLRASQLATCAALASTLPNPKALHAATAPPATYASKARLPHSHAQEGLTRIRPSWQRLASCQTSQATA